MAQNSISLPHICPECKKEAITYQEIEEKFGFRNMDENSMKAQSWCKVCRSKK